MIDLDSTTYLWIKALHIIAVIAWMAGMLYLPRLFIYHAAADPGSDSAASFKVMERRLLRAIMNPAMIATFVFGGLLLANLGSAAWSEGWLHVKLVCVLGLLILHMLMARYRRGFAVDDNQRSQLYYRILNETVTVFMVIIVIMVIVRPF